MSRMGEKTAPTPTLEMAPCARSFTKQEFLSTICAIGRVLKSSLRARHFKSLPVIGLVLPLLLPRRRIREQLGAKSSRSCWLIAAALPASVACTPKASTASRYAPIALAAPSHFKYFLILPARTPSWRSGTPASRGCSAPARVLTASLPQTASAGPRPPCG